jgi:hypothetical protein
MSVESTGELNTQEPYAENRIEALGPEYFQALALPKTYYGSDEAFFLRKAVYRGMPHELDVSEVETLTSFVGQRAVEIGLKHPERLETTMLKWLGRTSFEKQDTITGTSTLAVITRRENENPKRHWFGRRG